MMFDADAILARLADGDTQEEIVEDFITAMNDATKRHKEKDLNYKEEEFKDLAEHVIEILKDHYPDVIKEDIDPATLGKQLMEFFDGIQELSKMKLNVKSNKDPFSWLSKLWL